MDACADLIRGVASGASRLMTIPTLMDAALPQEGSPAGPSIRKLKEFGVDLNQFYGCCADKSDKTTLLHEIATSGHLETLALLQVALEVGCDPTLRRYDGKLPSTCVKDANIKEQWKDIERSFKAREQALAALDELDALMSERRSL